METARAYLFTDCERKEGCKRIVQGDNSGDKISSSNIRMIETVAVARMTVYREEDDKIVAFPSLFYFFVRFLFCEFSPPFSPPPFPRQAESEYKRNRHAFKPMGFLPSIASFPECGSGGATPPPAYLMQQGRKMCALYDVMIVGYESHFLNGFGHRTNGPASQACD